MLDSQGSVRATAPDRVPVGQEAGARARTADISPSRDADLRDSIAENDEVYSFLRSAAARHGAGFWGPGAGPGGLGPRPWGR